MPAGNKRRWILKTKKQTSNTKSSRSCKRKKQSSKTEDSPDRHRVTSWVIVALCHNRNLALLSMWITRSNASLLRLNMRVFIFCAGSAFVVFAWFRTALWIELYWLRGRTYFKLQFISFDGKSQAIKRSMFMTNVDLIGKSCFLRP